MTARIPISDLPALTARGAEVLAADQRVKLVYLFGSAVDGPSPRDLDFAIWTDPRFTGEELMKRRADLVVALKVPVDLVSLTDASITLTHEVVEHGRCIYRRDPALEIEFVTRSRSRYWDFQWYLAEQWRLAGQRLEERLSGP